MWWIPRGFFILESKSLEVSCNGLGLEDFLTFWWYIGTGMQISRWTESKWNVLVGLRLRNLSNGKQQHSKIFNKTLFKNTQWLLVLSMP